MATGPSRKTMGTNDQKPQDTGIPPRGECLKTGGVELMPVIKQKQDSSDPESCYSHLLTVSEARGSASTNTHPSSDDLGRQMLLIGVF